VFIARPTYLDALSKAWVWIKQTCLPTFCLGRDGSAWLQINQELPWPVVLKILQALKGSDNA
jgi:hypothetical protein